MKIQRRILQLEHAAGTSENVQTLLSASLRPLQVLRAGVPERDVEWHGVANGGAARPVNWRQ